MTTSSTYLTPLVNSTPLKKISCTLPSVTSPITTDRPLHMSSLPSIHKPTSHDPHHQESHVLVHCVAALPTRSRSSVSGTAWEARSSGVAPGPVPGERGKAPPTDPINRPGQRGLNVQTVHQPCRLGKKGGGLGFVTDGFLFCFSASVVFGAREGRSAGRSTGGTG